MDYQLPFEEWIEMRVRVSDYEFEEDE